MIGPGEDHHANRYGCKAQKSRRGFAGSYEGATAAAQRPRRASTDQGQGHAAPNPKAGAAEHSSELERARPVAALGRPRR